MNILLEGLPFSNEVKSALLGEENALRLLLNSIITCETANWNEAVNLYPLNMLGSTRFMELYMDALKWAKKLNY
ncbi:MAG: diguanylate phosphodiesterase, partial [Oscillospiraceae bacterium]|nr:diguanylate phosphodiesterase [Oscillospiraceae bacterium]